MPGTKSGPGQSLTRAQKLAIPGVALVGLVLGVLARLAHGLAGEWSVLGNSGALWVSLAFVVGARAKTVGHAAIRGLAALIGCWVGYYAIAMVGGATDSPAIMGLWVTLALVGGPVFGLAGVFRESNHYRFRILGSATLSGAIIAEGLFFASASPFFAATAPFRAAGYVEIGTGILVGLLSPRSRKERLGSLAIVPLFVLSGGVVYWAIANLRTHL